MSEDRKVTPCVSINFLIEERRKYSLKPICIESLQDEIIRLKKEEKKAKAEVWVLRKALHLPLDYVIQTTDASYIEELNRQSIIDSLNEKIAKLDAQLFVKETKNPLKRNSYKNLYKKSNGNKKTYLIKNNRNGFYKIGRSINPLRREQTLQSEEPDIVLVKTWSRNIESKLHKDYKEHRVRGEWFELSKAQVKYICTNYERSKISK